MSMMKKMAAMKAPLGSGKRFAAVAASAGGGEKGAAIAYKAGVKAHGKSKMAQLAAAGRNGAGND